MALRQPEHGRRWAWRAPSPRGFLMEKSAWQDVRQLSKRTGRWPRCGRKRSRPASILIKVTAQSWRSWGKNQAVLLQALGSSAAGLRHAEIPTL